MYQEVGGNIEINKLTQSLLVSVLFCLFYVALVPGSDLFSCVVQFVLIFCCYTSAIFTGC